MSREHVWPQWLAEALNGFGPFRASIDDRNWLTPEIDIRSSTVCAQCNTGWLSDLETATKPHLLPLVLGLEVHPRRPVWIDRNVKTILATWAAKTVLTHEPTRRERVIPNGEFWEFHRHRRPVGRQVILLGAKRGRRWATRSWREPLVGRSGHPVGYTAALVAGRVVFWIIRDQPAPQLVIDKSVADVMVPLWPASDEPVIWPPDGTLDDDTVDALTVANRHSSRGA